MFCDIIPVSKNGGITGMGVETSIGHTPYEFYNNLLEGVSGISEIKVFYWSNYPTVCQYSSSFSLFFKLLLDN